MECTARRRTADQPQRPVPMACWRVPELRRLPCNIHRRETAQGACRASALSPTAASDIETRHGDEGRSGRKVAGTLHALYASTFDKFGTTRCSRQPASPNWRPRSAEVWWSSSRATDEPVADFALLSQRRSALRPPLGLRRPAATPAVLLPLIAYRLRARDSGVSTGAGGDARSHAATAPTIVRSAH